MKNNMEDQHHQTIKRLHWYILILILAFIGLAWMIFNNQYDLVSKFKDLNVIKDISNQSGFNRKNKGSISIKSKEDLRRYRVGQPINLQVFADSVGEDILSFDVLVEYDKQAFLEPVIVTNLPRYIIITSERDDYISITAAQSPGSDERSVFDGNEVLNITFNSLKPGKYEIKIVSKKGEETTGFISTSSQSLLPQTSSFKVEIY